MSSENGCQKLDLPYLSVFLNKNSVEHLIPSHTPALPPEESSRKKSKLGSQRRRDQLLWESNSFQEPKSCYAKAASWPGLRGGTQPNPPQRSASPNPNFCSPAPQQSHLPGEHPPAEVACQGRGHSCVPAVAYLRKVFLNNVLSGQGNLTVLRTLKSLDSVKPARDTQGFHLGELLCCLGGGEEGRE